jgi:hypothetical protein
MKRMMMGLAAMVTIPCVLNASNPPVTSRFEVDVYGYIKLDASYDTQRSNAGDLLFYVNSESNGGKQPEFNMTARETRLGLNIKVPNVEKLAVTGKIETDFYGSTSANSPNIRMRLAYVDLAGEKTSLRVGQDWDTFLLLLPRIVNFSNLADAGSLGLRRPQARLTRVMDLGGDFRLTARIAAARTIGLDLDTDGQDDGSASGFPTAQGSLLLEVPVGYSAVPIRLGLSGHWGEEKVRAYETAAGDAFGEKNYETKSLIGTWSVPLLTVGKVEKVPLAGVQGTVWTGENLDTYFGGIRQGVNAAQQKGIRASGGWAQLVVHPTVKLNVNVGYAVDEPQESDLNSGDRTKNRTIFANVFYPVTSAARIMFEYTNMQTSYKDLASGKNDRFQIALMYNF